MVWDRLGERTVPVWLGELDAWNSSAQIGQEGLRKREVALDQVGPESAGTGSQAGIARFPRDQGWTTGGHGRRIDKPRELLLLSWDGTG